MSVGVVADDMAAIVDFENQLGVLLCVSADEEEAGRDVESREQVEQLWRDGGIGTVVEGDGQFARRVSAGDRFAEQLRARMYRAVGGDSRRSKQRGGRGNQAGAHDFILARSSAD